ncbi:MAG: hypothetical protein FD153_22 [Rhodospirillaceae bacterium]|nr:MAG: hypothetical protein FD153_22 [Rhodospirillaceae bacterium]
MDDTAQILASLAVIEDRLNTIVRIMIVVVTLETVVVPVFRWARPRVRAWWTQRRGSTDMEA